MTKLYGHMTNYVGLAIVALRRQDQDLGASGAQPARRELSPGIGTSARDPAQRGAAGHQGAGIGWHRDRPHGGSNASVPLEPAILCPERAEVLPTSTGRARDWTRQAGR